MLSNMGKFFLSAFFLFLAIGAQAEPVQWTVDSGGNGHWYEYITQPMSFDEAQAFAESQYVGGIAGHLATFSSEEEYSFVMGLGIPLSSPTKYGLYQLDGSTEPDGGWVWITGEPVVWTIWFPGEPNNSSSGEKIAMTGTFNTGYQWNDMPDWATGFVIEFPDEPTQEEHSLQFDGVDDYVYVSNSSLLSGDQLTAMCWFYHDGVGFSGNLINTGNQNDYGLGLDPEGRVFFNLHTEGGVYQLESNSQIVEAGWYHLAGVYNGSDHKLFINGVLDAERISAGTPGSGQEDNLTFGTYWLNGPHDGFVSGNLDDVSIWGRALEGWEIEVYMFSLPAMPAIGLLGFWDFNYGSGVTLFDISGNSNHGTIHGATWSEEVPPSNFGGENEGPWFVGETGNDLYSGTFDFPFATLSHAIARAADGDTIFVLPGEYSGPGFQDLIIQNKGIVFSGYDPNSFPRLLIDSGHSAISFIFSNSAVRNIQISGGETGFHFEHSDGMVEFCRFSDVGVSVFVDDDSGCQVLGSVFDGCNTGVKFSLSGVLDVISCSFTQVRVGIYGLMLYPRSMTKSLRTGASIYDTIFTDCGAGADCSPLEFYPFFFQSCQFSNVTVPCTKEGSFCDSVFKNCGGFSVGMEGYGTLSIYNCVIDSCGTAFTLYNDGTIRVNNTTVKNCTKIASFVEGFATEPSLYIDGCLLVGNDDGVTVDGYFARFEMTSTLFAFNNGSIQTSNHPYLHVRILDNTFFANLNWPVDFENIYNIGGGANIQRNIFAYSHAPAIRLGGGGAVSISNNVFFKNHGGSLIGGDDPVGTNGNLYADPRFCQLDVEEPTLAADSICLPANHPSGLLVGASEMGCSEAFEFTDIYVSPDTVSNGIGASPESPIGNIDVALDFLDPGGAVNFLEGTFEKALQINKPLTLKSHSGDPASVRIEPPTGHRPLTIMDAGDTVRVEGLTLAGGTPAQNDYLDLYDLGGAVFNVGTPLVLDNCVLEDNVVPADPPVNAGGAVLVRDSETGNGYLRMTSCLVRNNHAPRGGSVVVRSNAGCYLANNIIVENTSNSHASAIWILPASADNSYPYILHGNTIANNMTLETPGYGFAVSYAQNFQMHNNLVAFNGGGGPQVEFNASPTGLSCNLFHGLDDPYHVNPGFTVDPGGIVVASPHFCDMEAGDYTISDLSPASPLISSCGLIGALEPDCTGYPMSSVEDELNPVTEFRLYSAFPNPFNPMTTISFDLPERVPVDLRVYDLAGGQVSVLMSGEMGSLGRNEVVWTGRDQNGRLLPSGTYLYRLKAGDAVYTKRMTLLK
jgi:hypothetical protein